MSELRDLADITDFGSAAIEVSSIRFEGEIREELTDLVVTEFPLTIYLNNEELVTLLCTPEKFDYLAVGFLESEGLLTNRNEVIRLVIDAAKGRVWIETLSGQQASKKDMVGRRLIPSGCGRGAMFYSVLDAASQPRVTSKTTFMVDSVSHLMREFQRRSHLYRRTGGVHSAALCNGKEIVVFCEDIARHNAIDKVFGHCLLNNIETANHALLTSGRISSEILLKAARRGIPLVVSRSAPTSLSLKLANELGITIIGFARGKRLRVYTNAWRVTL